ncbi:DUF6350 family protein [Rhodococcus sp. G-MC3]|uniref:cell division protein PerM n=1 Tax=Rhodococcus sp. G-MC3 TaxID=3046209 RepID=UPI0024B8D79C|nr:DUF6350 family protein [Rhodococcus sp. G-MC3]MDJ0393936.1 DUF6350 family protein [Rhodococcus sp. G-MC3]
MSAVLNQEKQRTGRSRRPVQREPLLSPALSKTLVRVGFRTPGVLVAIIATVVLVTLVSVNSELTGTLGAIAGLWFAVHQVPLSISGTSLGVFPLLPTIVLFVVVARSVSRTVSAASARREWAWVLGAAVLGPVVVTALALAVAADASAAIGLSSPNALFAFAWVAGIHGVAAAVGVAIGTRDVGWVRGRVPEWIFEVVAPTVRAAAVLIAGAGGIFLASMLASWSTAGALLDAGNGFVGMLGLTLLSILYLPNVLLGTLAVSVGSSAHVGDVAVSMFRTAGGPVPPLPVLAVLPEGASTTFWTLMLVVPVAAGVILGRDCARRTVDVHYALSSVWVGSAAIGVASLLLGFAAGGNLGTFGTVSVTVWSFGLLAFAWLAVVGSIAAAITAWRGGSLPPHQADPAPDVAPERAPVAVPAIAEPVAHPRRAVDAELVEQPAPPAETDTGDETSEDVVEAEIVDAPAAQDATAEEVPAESVEPAAEAVDVAQVVDVAEVVDVEAAEDTTSTDPKT